MSSKKRTNDDFSVRNATSSDASEIARIYSEAILARNATMILDPVTQEQMHDKLLSLGERETILVLVDSNEHICGWGIVKMYSDRPGYARACETSLFIDVDSRGQGLGKMLQTYLNETARDSGFHHIIVRIWAANEISIALHEKCGFTMVGVQKEIGHVDSEWIDVAVMQCLLDQV